MENTVESIVKQVDSMEDSSTFEEQLRILQKANEDFPNNIDILWRLARSYYQNAVDHPEDKVRQEKLFNEGLVIATQAVQVDPNHDGGYKWSGVLTNSVDDFKSKKEKIADAFKIKDFFQTAERLNPNDATTKFCLGRWCYTVSSISWVERNAAALLFATPPESSYEEALTYFHQALVLAEENPVYQGSLTQIYFMLGKTYNTVNKKEEGDKFYKKCIESKPYSVDDRTYIKEATAALAPKTGWF